MAQKQPKGISNATLTDKIRIDELTNTGTLRQTEGAHQCSKPFFGGVLGTGGDFGGVLDLGTKRVTVYSVRSGLSSSLDSGSQVAGVNNGLF